MPRIKDLGLVISDKMFSCFPDMTLCKTCDPQGGALFWSQGHNLNKLGSWPGKKTPIKCQGSKVVVSFLSFHLENPLYTS